LLSSHETPETRALYNNSLLNVAGKIRTQRHWPPIVVPAGMHPVSFYLFDGIRPDPVYKNFIPFHCTNPKDEAEKRFHHFTTQVLHHDLLSKRT